MGVVYRARQIQLNRDVALKMILSGAHAGKNAHARFFNEAQTVAKLQHPGIVQIYDYGVHDGLPWCALELTTGGSLADRTRGQVSSPQAAARLVMQLARTMQAAHAAGVVHRDLKPGNILFASDGQPKITDFGIAKTIGNNSDSATLTGEILGTPNYMAPEQAWGESKDVGPAADVYALGVILYEQLTGQVPFIGQERLDILTRVRTMEPVSPRRRVPSVPADLDVVCLKCLEKEPSRRYPSAEALADDLERFLSDKPVLARRPNVFERGLRWRRRNPQLAGMAIALVTLTVLAFVMVTQSYLQTQAALRDEAVQRKLERWERYRAEITAASSALQLHNVTAAKLSLESTPEELRGWEWRYFMRRIDASSLAIDAFNRPLHGNIISSSSGVARMIDAGRSFRTWDLRRKSPRAVLPAFETWLDPRMSDDGSLVCRAVEPNDVEVWDAVGGTRKFLLKGHRSPVRALVISADNRRLASSSHDGTLCVWDLTTGTKLQQSSVGPKPVHVLGISPTGDVVCVSSKDFKLMHLWKVGSPSPYADLIGATTSTNDAAFSPPGDRVVTVELYPSNVARIWNVSDGREIACLRGHSNQIWRSKFSRDGRRFVTGSSDRTIRVWDAIKGTQITQMKGHAGVVYGIDFNSDGTRVVSGAQDHTVREWDVQSSSQLSVFHGHTDDVNAVTYLNDRTIASLSKDGTIRYWDSESIRRDGRLIGHTSFVYSVAFHPDGERVGSCAWDGTARIWNARTGQLLQTLRHDEKDFVTSIVFSSDGIHAATTVREGSLRWWNLQTGRVERKWKVPIERWFDTRAALSADGETLAMGGEGEELHLFRVRDGAEIARTARRPRGFITEVAFSPNGRWLATSLDDAVPAVRVFSLPELTERLVLEGHQSGTTCVAFSPDSRWIASGANDHTTRLWDAETGELAAILNQDSNVHGIAFSPDGARLACACADGAIRLWDVATRKQVAELQGHESYVHNVAFSPDGGRLASASGDHTARIWVADEPPAGKTSESPDRSSIANHLESSGR